MSKLSLKPDPTLPEYQQYIRDMLQERGFQSDIKYLAQRFMLLTEEVGEFAKASRHVAGLKMASDDQSQQSVADEAADVLIVLLGICNMLDIDLEKAFRDKEAKNSTRTWS